MLNGAPNRRERPSVKASVLHSNTSYALVLYNNATNQTINYQLGVILHEGLSFDLHVTSLLKQCSQRIYLLRLLRSQRMSSNHLNTIFHAIIFSRILMPFRHGVFLCLLLSLIELMLFLSEHTNVDFVKNSLLSMSCYI